MEPLWLISGPHGGLGKFLLDAVTKSMAIAFAPGRRAQREPLNPSIETAARQRRNHGPACLGLPSGGTHAAYLRSPRRAIADGLQRYSEGGLGTRRSVAGVDPTKAVSPTSGNTNVSSYGSNSTQRRCVGASAVFQCTGIIYSLDTMRRPRTLQVNPRPVAPSW